MFIKVKPTTQETKSKPLLFIIVGFGIGVISGIGVQVEHLSSFLYY